MKHDTLTPETHAEIVADFPLSAGQFRCWFTNQMKPGTPSLNVSVRWELNGNLQTTHLEQAFQQVIDRHEILRTRFVDTGDAPVQQVMDHAPFKLHSVDIRAVPAADQPQRVEDIAREFSARPFDLGTAGLIRASLIRLTAERAIVVLVVHRICFDGHSIGVLGREVGEIARALEAGEEPDLPELQLQYGDFTLWQEEYLASGVQEEETTYWQNHLKDAPYFALEPDKPRPPVRGAKGASVSLDLAPDFGDKLDAIAKQLDVSKFALGAAIFSACLTRISNSHDIVFGCQVSSRHAVELEPLIGMLTNNLVLRLTTDANTSLADHIHASKATIQDALMHQNLPFNTLVEKMNPPRDPSRTPLVSINFGLQTVFMDSRQYGDFELRSTPSHEPGAYYDIDFAVMSRPTGWQLNLVYSPDLFNQDTANGIMESVEQAFDALFTDTQTPLSQLAIPASLQDRTARNRATEIALEQTLCAHRLVADAHVMKTDDTYYGFITPQNTGLLPLEQLADRVMTDLEAEADLSALSGLSLLASLPRDENGTVDSRALRPPHAPTARKTDAQPKDDVEATLTRDWCELLDVPVVHPSDNFFDLGGHSVLMLRLLVRLQERWNVQVEIGEVFEHARLSDFIALIKSKKGSTPEAAEQDWRVIRIAKEGTGAPLIAINNAATAQAFAAEPAFDHVTKCVRVNENGRGYMPEETTPFEDVAREYAEVIRNSKTEGPLVLYGNCVHGNLALETARQLQADGQEIAGVVMKDVWEPGYTKRLTQNRMLNLREKLNALRVRIRAVRRGEMSLPAFMGSYRAIRATGILQIAQGLGLIDRVRVTDLEQEQERFISLVSHIRDGYRPQPVDFPVLHIVTDATPTGKGFSNSIGWENIVAKDKLHTVHLDEAKVVDGKRYGIDRMVAEIESFLSRS